jgi:hypothetical protein
MTSSLLYPNYNPIIYSSHLVLEAAFSSLPYPTRLVITFLPGQFLPCAYGRVILRLSILFPGLAACPAHTTWPRACPHSRLTWFLPCAIPVQHPCRKRPVSPCAPPEVGPCLPVPATRHLAVLADPRPHTLPALASSLLHAQSRRSTAISRAQQQGSSAYWPICDFRCLFLRVLHSLCSFLARAIRFIPWTWHTGNCMESCELQARRTSSTWGSRLLIARDWCLWSMLMRDIFPWRLAWWA